MLSEAQPCTAKVTFSSWNKKRRERLEGLGQSPSEESSPSETSSIIGQSKKPVAVYGFGDEEKRRLRNKKQREWYATRKDSYLRHNSESKKRTAVDASNSIIIGSFNDDDVDDADNRIIDETDDEDHVPATCIDEGIKRKNDFERGL